MTLLLALLMALTPALPDTCDVPPIVTDEWPADDSEWERNPDGSKEAITDLGHSLRWQGPDCEPYAVWGDRASNFVWVRSMREIMTYGRPVRTELEHAAEALAMCLERNVWRDCELLTALVRTQQNKRIDRRGGNP